MARSKMQTANTTMSTKVNKEIPHNSRKVAAVNSDDAWGDNEKQNMRTAGN